MAPSITQLQPNSGVAGETISIVGSGFGNSKGASTVVFGATAATSFSSWTNSSISVVVPAGTAGAGVDVVVTVGNTASGPKFFWYRNPSFPTSAKIFEYQDTRADGDLADVTKANAETVNFAYQEIEAIEARLLDHLGLGGSAEHAVATASVAGFMSAADKTAWDAHHGQGGTSQHPAATGGASGFLSTSNKAKLDGLTYYDSGWFTADPNTEYTITHNLGTAFPFVAVAYRSDDSDSWGIPVSLALVGSSNKGSGPQIKIPYSGGALSTTQIKVLAKDYLITIWDVATGPSYITSGDYRVVVRRQD